MGGADVCHFGMTAESTTHIRKTAPRFLPQLALAQLVDLEMGAVTAETVLRIWVVLSAVTVTERYGRGFAVGSRPCGLSQAAGRWA